MANTPINIADLVPSDVVRIQLLGPFVFLRVDVGHALVTASQRATGFRQSMVVANVRQNDFANRTLVVEFTDTTLPQQHFVVEIPYGRMRVIEKQIPGALISDNTHRLRIPAYVPVLGVF